MSPFDGKVRGTPYPTEDLRIPTSLHGEEAAGVGVMQALRPEDAIVSTYREHGRALATGGWRQLAAQHSHSLEARYAHIPGIEVLTPRRSMTRTACCLPRCRIPTPQLTTLSELVWYLAPKVARIREGSVACAGLTQLVLTPERGWRTVCPARLASPRSLCIQARTSAASPYRRNLAGASR